MGQSNRRAWSGLFRAAFVATGLLGAVLTTSGCSVSDSDVKRWEKTERGPFKLYAVITHDKFALPLRTEAALAFIRMAPRNGKRIGSDCLMDKCKDDNEDWQQGALLVLSEERRKDLVNSMTPELVKNIKLAPGKRGDDGRLATDPSLPYKDAAFAMLSHEPSLVSDDKTKATLKAALTEWAQTAFEDRIENSSQQFGVEQVMRFLGAPSVRALPGMMTDNANRLDRMVSLVSEIGDEETKKKGSDALVALANLALSDKWLADQTKMVKEHNAKSNLKVDDAGVKVQVTKIQDRRLTEELFPAMKKLGGRSIVEFLVAFAADPKNSDDRRKTALAALEGRVDKNNDKDIDRLFQIAKDEATPDATRDVVFARLGELPKEKIVGKLYTLFDQPKKWKIRWVAASVVLKVIKQKDVPEFMTHLPKSAATKMGMGESVGYGEIIGKMEGDPKPKDVVAPYLKSGELGPKLTAIGLYYGGKKADQGVLQPLEGDRTPLPKCDAADECGWQCDVPKASNPKEFEPKVITTVGEYVKSCVIPSMEAK